MSFLPKTALLSLLLLISNSAFSMDGEQPFFNVGKSAVNSQKIDQDSYFSMFQKMEQKPDLRGIFWVLDERLKDLDKIFNSLNITLPQSQIIDIFNKYNVLMHRPLTHDKLIIGCGNLPPYEPTISVFYIDYLDMQTGIDKTYRVKHAHRDSDTIDPDFARDPTIVAEVGKIDPNLFKGKKYKSIVIEGILILPDELKKAGGGGDDVRESLKTAQTLYQILDDEGTLTTANNVVMSKERLESYVTYWSTSPELENYIAFISEILGPGTPSPAPVKSSSSSENPVLSESLEEFMEQYNVTFEEILKDLHVEEDEFWIIAQPGWTNVEAYELSPEFKERVYGK